jgi:hypothetical protein
MHPEAAFQHIPLIGTGCTRHAQIDTSAYVGVVHYGLTLFYSCFVCPQNKQVVAAAIRNRGD